MKAARFEVPMVGVVQPGDRWFVESVDAAAGTVTFARATPEPDQYRSPRDGLHPRVPPPDTRPITADEARKVADEMDAAMAAERDKLRDWAFSPHNPLNARDCPGHDTRCRPGDCVLRRPGAASRPQGFRR